MHSVYDQGLFAPPPRPFNMAAHVLRHAETLAEKEALVIVAPDQTAEVWTYKALASAVRGTAAGLLQHGLTPGDKVMLRLGNTVDFPIAYLGALAAGLVPVPTAASLTVPEVAKMSARIKPDLILHDPTVSCPEDCPPILETAVLREMRMLPPADYHMGSPDRLGYIVFTSGTSGTPTPVMHAHRAIWARQMMFEGWYDLGVDDRLCHAGAFIC